MTTEAKIGYGSQFELWDGAAFVELSSEVNSIAGPNLASEAIDVTAIGSPNGYREFIQGLKDAGDLTIEMNLVPGGAADALIRTLFEAGEAVQWRVTIPSAGSPSTEQMTGNAIITGYSYTVPAAEKMAATLTLKVTGPVTFATF